MFDSNGSSEEFFLSRSTNDGLSFSTPKNINASLTSPGFTLPLGVSLFVPPNGGLDLAAVVPSSVFFLHSHDGGDTFSAPVNVWNPLASEETPNTATGVTTVAGSNGQVYVFWDDKLGLEQCDLLFSRSLDGAHTFSSAANLSNSQGCSNLEQMPILDAEGAVNLSWVTLGFDDDTSLFFSRSTDEGATFSAPTNVSGGFFPSNDNAGPQEMVIDSDGTITVLWKAISSDGDSQPVVIARSVDHGHTFSVPYLLSHNYVSQPSLPASDIGVTEPAIALDPHGNVAIAYGEGDASAIFFRRSTDEGVSFSNPLKFSPVAPEFVSQLLFDKHGDAYILSVGTELPSNNFDIYFNRLPASTSLEGAFRIKVLPKIQDASQGETLHFTVTARSTDTHHHALQLSCGDLPFNEPVSPMCTFTPFSLSSSPGGTTADLTLTIPANEPTGTFLFEVQGEGGATIDTGTEEVTVQ